MRGRDAGGPGARRGGVRERERRRWAGPRGPGLRAGPGRFAALPRPPLRAGRPPPARRAGGVRAPPRRPARPPGGGQQVGIVVRALPRGVPLVPTTSRPSSGSGSPSWGWTRTTRAAAAKTFLEEFPVPYPSYSDPGQEIARAIEASGRISGDRLLRLEWTARLRAAGPVPERVRPRRRHQALRALDARDARGGGASRSVPTRLAGRGEFRDGDGRPRSAAAACCVRRRPPADDG